MDKENGPVAYQPMKGVRILEVAQFTFTPAAGAVLADWGASVIKVEHPVFGDAQRALVGYSATAIGSFKPIIEHPNRGKRSIGVALDHPAGREILHELASTSDVFLTNFLPGARRRLEIDVTPHPCRQPADHLRPGLSVWPQGSGVGERRVRRQRLLGSGW
jgi:crotonobetainyl-CoA:carnitine CoA-transferase CaiB-like acyl-CoA transferase